MIALAGSAFAGTGPYLPPHFFPPQVCMLEGFKTETGTVKDLTAPAFRCSATIVGARELTSARHCFEGLYEVEEPGYQTAKLEELAPDYRFRVVCPDEAPQWLQNITATKRSHYSKDGSDGVLVTVAKKLATPPIVPVKNLEEAKLLIATSPFCAKFGYGDATTPRSTGGNAQGTPQGLEVRPQHITAFDTIQNYSIPGKNGEPIWHPHEIRSRDQSYAGSHAGDSGGPLVCQDKSGRWRLVGITSALAGGKFQPHAGSLFSLVRPELLHRITRAPDSLPGQLEKERDYLCASWNRCAQFAPVVNLARQIAGVQSRVLAARIVKRDEALAAEAADPELAPALVNLRKFNQTIARFAASCELEQAKAKVKIGATYRLRRHAWVTLPLAHKPGDTLDKDFNISFGEKETAFTVEAIEDGFAIGTIELKPWQKGDGRPLGCNAPVLCPGKYARVKVSLDEVDTAP